MRKPAGPWRRRRSNGFAAAGGRDRPRRPGGRTSLSHSAPATCSAIPPAWRRCAWHFRTSRSSAARRPARSLEPTFRTARCRSPRFASSTRGSASPAGRCRTGRRAARRLATSLGRSPPTTWSACSCSATDCASTDLTSSRASVTCCRRRSSSRAAWPPTAPSFARRSSSPNAGWRRTRSLRSGSTAIASGSGTGRPAAGIRSGRSGA